MPEMDVAKVLAREELAAWGAEQRSAGRSIAFSNGCFDLLHRGHLDSLMLLLSVAMIWAFDAKRLVVAGIALGSAIAAKTIVVVLLPWFLLRAWRVALVAAVGGRVQRKFED